MFKILDEVCKPKRSTKYSAYVDLFARENVTISAGETKVIPLGVKLDINKINKIVSESFYYKEDNDLDFAGTRDKFMKSHYLEVALRSSLGVKGLTIPNGIGIIDLDFADEIGLIMYNPLKKPSITFDKNNIKATFKMSFGDDFTIKKGDKVAQCTLKEHKSYLMGYESEVVRDGGFGSTGK